MEIPGYTLERRIGTGGQAIVYEAVQRSLERRVALKVLNPVLSGNPEFTERFLNEGRILASLGHSHVITIHDIGVVGDLHYLSMELVEGGDLRARIREGLTPDTALDYVAIIADCLGRAHERQVVHRDIKPANVLFRTDGTLLLTDFGIAKMLGASTDLTLTGTTLGSPSYLSPEQARNLPLDGRADIYSLGAMAFEMLAGRKPFSADSEFATIHHHLTSPVPALPAGLEAYQPLIERMMAKSPDDRFASIDELIEALRVLRPAIPVPPRAGERLETAAADAAASPTAPTLPMHAFGEPRPEPPPRDDDEITLVNIRTPPPAPAARRVPVGLLAVAAVAVAAALALGLDGDAGGAPDDLAGAAPAAPGPEASAAAQPHDVQAVRVPGPAAEPPVSQGDASPPAAPATAVAGAPPPVRAAGQPPAPAVNQPPAHAAAPVQRPPPASTARPEAATAAAPGPAPSPVAGSDEARVQALLASARRALDDLRLTRPETDSAMFFYDQVLVIEPDNAEARRGHRLVADRYAELARGALARGDTSRARALVSRGLSVDAGNSELLALRGELDTDRGAERQASAAPANGEIRGETPKQLYRRIQGWFN